MRVLMLPLVLGVVRLVTLGKSPEDREWLGIQQPCGHLIMTLRTITSSLTPGPPWPSSLGSAKPLEEDTAPNPILEMRRLRLGAAVACFLLNHQI